MVTKANKADKGDKPKTPAVRLDITQLMVDSAYAKTFSSGKGGFFGKATDPRTGKRYQIIGAVQLN
jgi:hypothetical protein